VAGQVIGSTGHLNCSNHFGGFWRASAAFDYVFGCRFAAVCLGKKHLLLLTYALNVRVPASRPDVLGGNGVPAWLAQSAASLLVCRLEEAFDAEVERLGGCNNAQPKQLQVLLDTCGPALLQLTQ
jgi:hypothetical protein